MMKTERSPSSTLFVTGFNDIFENNEFADVAPRISLTSVRFMHGTARPVVPNDTRYSNRFANMLLEIDCF